MIEARTMQQRGERAACVEGADEFLIKVTNGNDRQDRALAPLVEDVIHPSDPAVSSGCELGGRRRAESD